MPLRHFGSYTTCTATPLVQLCHFCSYATLAVTPLVPLRHFGSYATCVVNYATRYAGTNCVVIMGTPRGPLKKTYIRNTADSRHNGGLIKGPPQCESTVMARGVLGCPQLGHRWETRVPRKATTSDRCFFSSQARGPSRGGLKCFFFLYFCQFYFEHIILCINSLSYIITLLFSRH